LLIVGLAMVISPLVFPISAASLLGSPTPAVEVGLLQVLWGPILLVLFILTISMALLRPARPELESSLLESPAAASGVPA